MAADPTYSPKTYRNQGGDEIVIAASGALTVESSGEITVESGGTIDVESGGGIDIESGADIDIESGGVIDVIAGGIIDLKTGAVIKDTTAGAITDRFEFVDTVAWTGVASTAGGHGNWTAPASSNILITGFYLDITTACTTGSAKIDVGTATTSITTAGTDLMNSLVVTGSGQVKFHSATGTVGIELKAGKFITAGATGTQLDSLVSKAYIKYIVV